VPASGFASELNGGVFCSVQDPDNNNWPHPVFRINHSDYGRDSRSGTNLINYSHNTGIVLDFERDIFLALTMETDGSWKFYIILLLCGLKIYTVSPF